jgi:hypothetical protein
MQMLPRLLLTDLPSPSTDITPLESGKPLPAQETGGLYKSCYQQYIMFL